MADARKTTGTVSDRATEVSIARLDERFYAMAEARKVREDAVDEHFTHMDNKLDGLMDTLQEHARTGAVAMQTLIDGQAQLVAGAKAHEELDVKRFARVEWTAFLREKWHACLIVLAVILTLTSGASSVGSELGKKLWALVVP